MKSVIVAVGILGITTVSGILLSYLDQRQIPINLIMAVTVVTAALAKFFQNPLIQEFSYRKLSQQRTKLMETLLGFKAFFSKIKNNKVGVKM